jgi:hypothetical protein
MANFIIDCRSGVRALVSDSSIERAQENWDAAVECFLAEPGKARRPRHGEVREIARDGTHDYR